MKKLMNVTVRLVVTDVMALLLTTAGAQDATKAVPPGMVLVPGGSFDMGDPSLAR